MKYFSENVSGNMHDAVSWINRWLMKEHPEADVVTIESDGYNSIVVWKGRYLEECSKEALYETVIL